MTEQLFKPAKPHTFDGSDTTLVAVKTWTYTVEEYMEFAKIPAANQTRVAAMFLADTAKMWYINTYVIPETPLPDLKTFLVAFKEHHRSSESSSDIRRKIETIKQKNRSVADYGTEFESLINELGKGVDLGWAKDHFIKGLEDVEVRLSLLSLATFETETIKELTKKGHRLQQAVQQSRPRTSYKPPTPGKAPAAFTSSQPNPNPGAKLTKLSEKEREEHRAKGLCFKCRRHGHIARDCPDGGKEIQVKKESVNEATIVEQSDSDFEYPSVPTIKVHTVIQGTPVKALVDCGATPNILSIDFIHKRRLRTVPARPVYLHQAMSPHGIHVNEKVISNVEIPSKSWKSSRPHSFLVAPLKNNDAILGMSFLKAEKALVDAENSDIIVSMQEKDDEELETSLKGVTLPSFCPKITRNQTSKEPTISPDQASLLNIKYFDRYSDVFSDKPPTKPFNPNAPYHRITLANDKQILNGRMFRIFTCY